MRLVIGNKRYSSWSLRPWLLMRHLGLPFEEEIIPLGAPDSKERILRRSPAGKVPVLIDEDAAIWESLAIIDTLADAFPERAIWPRDKAARAMARATAAEMHSGFQALRTACPMNLGQRYAARDRGEAVANDVQRITAIWQEARERFGRNGLFLFGEFSAADAMYAPVAGRFHTYSIALDPLSEAYKNEILSLPAFHEWRDAALKETWRMESNELEETIIPSDAI